MIGRSTGKSKKKLLFYYIKNYINKKNTYLDSIGKNYQLKVETKIEKNITIEKMSIINKLEYIEGE